uniref:UDENN domain-containing protein n=1 Tax=Mucochytrium quahogii TaxID=96639 RepID=A0A7S2RHS4_9STRA|mmetsp:Transcript_22580/g.35967  ORF Transcript_22580/g.35967 Transcript_22580/m.35967 type:complete len:1169 (-) Transcript_22580:457-3963(-)|eukprot:CAMPEP_0203760536 /NCGR_PEP_ID=MMETSP0098-20131031/13804_1 /ASSEMBLY_ACC=CAM_ASM_000208 /TAXON_ID=96639 /ORGANISM=" , Strain NY0313808BC1" /LENGTH=1168 /DNA_ID=CAMNT_0050654139 /DNA_START=559 /DNA_END=4065 /DNA_ORIENTATION=+
MNSNNPHSRLIEYFLVVGVNDEQGLSRVHTENPKSGSIQDELYAVQVLDRFPVVDHKDVDFPSGVPVFCFADGGASLVDRMEMPVFFEFVTTGGCGGHLYGYALTIYEPLAEHMYCEEWNRLNKRFYVPKCLCILSHWPFRSQYRTFLTQLYRLSISPVTVPLERIISNFVCEVPVPPPGKVRILHNIGDAELVFTRPPVNNPISWTDLGFQQVFEALDLHNILRVFSALLTERQILVRSSQRSLLTTFGEVMRALLYPFCWSHVYIPLLPKAMLMVLQAPLPFMIGVHEPILESALAAGLVPQPTTVIVNLDRNEVTVSSLKYAILELPVHDTKKLLSRISQCAPAFRNRQSFWQRDILPFMDSAICHAVKPYEIDDYTVAHVRQVAQSADGEINGRTSVWCTLRNGECNWPMVRTAFFRFFVSLLRDYKDFLIYPIQKPTKKAVSINKEQRAKANGSFDFVTFLSRRKKSEHAFMSCLVQTQHFQCFVDDRLHPDGAHDADVVFFDQSLGAKHNRSFLTRMIPVMKSETRFLNDHQYDITKTVVTHPPDSSDVTRPNEYWMPENPQKGYDRFPRLLTDLYGTIRPVSEIVQRLKSEAFMVSKARRLNTGTSMLDSFSGASDAIYATWFLLFCASIGRDSEFSQQLANLGRGVHYVDRMSIWSESTLDENECERDSLFSRRISGQEIARRTSMNSVDVISKEANFSLSQLDVAFDVLDASQKWGTAADEVVYRSLIDACGRCGHTDYAIRVLGMMHQKGMSPDALVYSNLVQSFSMNGDVNHSLKLDILDWEKLRQEVSEANRRIEQRTSQRRMIRKHMSSASTSTKSNNGSTLRTHQSSPSNDTIEPPTSHTPQLLVRKTIQQWGSRGSARLPQDDLSTLDEKPSFRKLQDMLFGSRSQLEGEEKDAASSVYSSDSVEPARIAFEHTHMERIFPGLTIDTERETCPGCHMSVCDEELRKGWNRDANDYTTACPNCGRKFVAFFTVASQHPTWVGSKGVGTELFCEFLPPWALSKEVQTVLLNHDIEFVCRERFRETNPTVFWNLVLYFTEFNLPMEFLTGPYISTSPHTSPPVSPILDVTVKPELVLQELRDNNNIVSPTLDDSRKSWPSRIRKSKKGQKKSLPPGNYFSGKSFGVGNSQNFRSSKNEVENAIQRRTSNNASSPCR